MKNRLKIYTILFLLFLGVMWAIAIYSNRNSNNQSAHTSYRVHQPTLQTPKRKITQGNQQVIIKKSENEAEEKKNNQSAKNIKGAIPKETNNQSSALYPVIKVIDGDTLSVKINGQIEVLRLIGINTPETVDPRKAVECFGKEASAKAKELLMGQNVKLEAEITQGERDKYNRLLRYIFLENGKLFNDMMIREGYAYEYTYSKPYKYQAQFKQAEKEAREHKRGLWADDTCDGTLTSPINSQAMQETEKKEPAQTPVVPDISTCVCESNQYNCTDFKSYAEAQSVYECCFKKTGIDVHRLDQDKDGLACENLP